MRGLLVAVLLVGCGGETLTAIPADLTGTRWRRDSDVCVVSLRFDSTELLTMSRECWRFETSEQSSGPYSRDLGSNVTLVPTERTCADIGPEPVTVDLTAFRRMVPAENWVLMVPGHAPTCAIP